MVVNLGWDLQSVIGNSKSGDHHSHESTSVKPPTWAIPTKDKATLDTPSARSPMDSPSLLVIHNGSFWWPVFYQWIGLRDN